jgi:hypothetical protein
MKLTRIGLGCLVALCAVACAAPQPAPVREVPPPKASAKLGSPENVAPTAAETEDSSPSTPVTNGPGAEAIRHRDMLASICQPVFIPERKDWGGCAECPKFTGSPESGIRPDLAFMVGHVVVGSFRKAGATEALLRFSGCESRVDGFGGTVLLTNQGSSWEFASYESGDWDDCTPMTSEGRTRFVCRSGFYAQGAISESVLVRDYAQSNPIFLFELGDNTNTACFPEPRAGAYYSGTIDAMGWLNLDKVGPRDVGVSISFASEIWQKVPSEDSCKQAAEAMQQRLKEHAHRELLEFLSSGTGYVPSPATKRTLDRITAQMRYVPPVTRHRRP